MEELSKTYSPKETEDKIYSLWEESDAFKPLNTQDSELQPFSIVIPPPNVTGSLHMGHALNNTIQDILVRRARMQGRPTLWLPGTDHAGIATQNVVEKNLAKKGIKKQDLGREKFVEEIEKWVDEYGHIIIDQLKKMGCSCDWSKQRYTMDESYKEAVNTAFKHYYDKGLIYEGERVVNWCPHCQTALSDIEIEYQPQKTTLYYFKYDKNFPITIATTRPETKLGDVAVAVNPDDSRYKEFIGQTFEVNFCGSKRSIKVIADKAVDLKFGTGALGVTPAHSIIDSELAEKNKLDSITIIDKYGKMNENAGEFNGLKAAEAREKIVECLKKNGLLEKTEEIENNLSVCYRCNRPIEPQPSKQWFLKMSELAKPAIEAVEKGEIKFTPERWEKVYLDWMKNLKDWCISRQIWWGHKIPLDGVDDVLDTWFSSALWPFATLGWPEETEDLKTFYPTTTLSTARDIIYLWVSRMIFSGFEFMNEKPFSDVYIHPTVFNKEGKRMSKSLGTGVDPIELIDRYGADATRFGLMYINTGIQDIKFDEAAILASQKFANKIWNVARFTILQVESHKVHKVESRPTPKTEADKKILARLSETIESVNKNLDEFKFGQAAHDLYDFIWHDLADRYIEESKKDPNPEILLFVLRNSLLLLHPFMPFVTEEIWQKLYSENLVEEKLLITAKWPN